MLVQRPCQTYSAITDGSIAEGKRPVPENRLPALKNLIVTLYVGVGSVRAVVRKESGFG